METLILTPWDEPLARVSWKRAITLVVEGKVEVVEEYPARAIRTVTLSWAMPSVVRFLRAIRVHRRGPKFSRENVYARDGGRCQYCARRLRRDEATWDHVTPRALGGKTTWENVVVCCLGCNQRKGARRPEQAGMRLDRAPVRPKADAFRLTVGKSMPDGWRAWVRSLEYWNGELDNENENEG